MNHEAARTAIRRILEQPGFDGRALALVQAALLIEHPWVPEGLGARLLAAAAARPQDAAPATAPPGIPGPIPDDKEGLAAQVLPLVIRHPAQTGVQAACLHALIALWPHATREERLRLRRQWYGSVLDRTAPPASFITREQLCAWQRDLPTSYQTGEVCPSVLATLVDEPSAEKAYQAFAHHLGPSTDLHGLSWSLGVCAQQVLLHRFDFRGAIQQALVGAAACELLVDVAPPSELMALFSQVAHLVWWCRNGAGGRGLQSGSTDSGVNLRMAVAAGDYTASQRAARRAVRDPKRFWTEISEMVVGMADVGSHHWPRALAALCVLSIRSGRNLPGPDDAAAAGATLAAVSYLDAHRT